MTNDLLSSVEVERLRRAELTYGEVGRTDGTLPAGYTHLRRSADVGYGVERFDEASRRVLSWEVLRRAGLGVRPSDPMVVDRAVAVLRAGIGIVGLDAPVRVVHVVDEPHRQGFAYGTLPGHPVSGEESFVVEMHDDGRVSMTVTAFSRPATRLARLGGPVGRRAQSWMISRYLGAV